MDRCEIMWIIVLYGARGLVLPFVNIDDELESDVIIILQRLSN